MITGFGSVKMNGVEYATQNTSFNLNGQAGFQKDLKLGMVVTAYGSQSSNGATSAATIIQEDVVDGAVQSIPATNDRIIVLGQTVLIDEHTLFDTSISPSDIGGLAVGQQVAVNGFVKEKGVTIATLIEKKSPSTTCQLKGIVENHNSISQTFVLGGVTVNYHGADFRDMPKTAGTTWDLTLVKVNGTPCDQITTTINATNVQPERITLTNGDEITLQGAITLFNSPTSFSVNGVPVVINSFTREFENGGMSDLALGVLVWVEGVVSNGGLTLKEVSFRDHVEIEGDVTALAPLTIAGLSPITLTSNTQTSYPNGSVAVNDHIRVRGRQTGTNTILAATVEKLPSDTRVVLQGVIQTLNTPNVMVLGYSIDTTPIVNTNFIDLTGPAIGRAAFFSTVTKGWSVKAIGILNMTSGSVVWSEMATTGEGDADDGGGW